LAIARPNGYWALSRTLTYSLTFAVPLLVVYEALVLRLHRYANEEIRNLGDWIVRGLLGTVGIHGPAGVTAALIIAALVLIVRERLRAPVPIRPRVFGLMVVECSILALGFGVVVRLLTAGLLAPLNLSAVFYSPTAVTPQISPIAVGAQLETLPRYYQLVLALGAGIYEELVFRALAIGVITGIILAVARLIGARMPRELAVGTAVLTSALIFSLFHYVGPFGDALQVWTFAYRFMAGLAFSAIYAYRGFGIVAWTHALYDVILILTRA
jgi:membrane protease YdiL (CAAX protease family)